MSLLLFASVAGIALLGSFLARAAERRLAASVWSICIVVAAASFITATIFSWTGNVPSPMPWSATVSSTSEPWQGLFGSLLLAVILLPSLNWLEAAHDAGRMWITMLLAALCSMSSLPGGEAYQDVVPGNAFWSLAAVLSTGLSCWSLRSLNGSGGGSLGLWILTAFTAAVSAVLLSCYGTLGESCAAVFAATAAAAVVRSCSAQASWHTAWSVLPLFMSTQLITHVRIYSSTALPAYAAVLLFLFLPIVCGADRVFCGKASLKKRTLLAAVLSGVLCMLIIVAIFVGGSGETEAW
ncbi:MAG: hypothetical protein U0892_07365 [Pirellulales bacterium]